MPNFSIATKDGPVTVTGYHSGVPGIIVTRSGINRRGWALTHRASGYRIWGDFDTRAEAREIATIIGGCTDWTASAEIMIGLARETDLGTRVRYAIVGDVWPSTRREESSVVESILPAGWELEGDDLDGLLICPHGSKIEMDGICPDGCVSPLRTAGLI